MKTGLAVILIGPQGSGKGTQASLLKKHFHMCYIAGGNIARELARQHTELGKEVRELMNEGRLLPDNILNKGAQTLIHHCSHPDSLLFDGYPRTLEQARFIYDYLESHHYHLLVIELELDDTASIARIKERYVCSGCGSIIYKYAHQHLTSLQKYRQARDRCIHCGGKIVRRSDDTEASVRERLHLYHKNSRSVLRYFKEKKVLKTVDAKPQIEDVYRSIETMVNHVNES